MRTQNMLCAGLVLVSLGGCGTLYVPPSGTPTIDVRLINHTSGVASAYYIAGAKKCTDMHPVAGVQPGEDGVIKLPADHIATLALGTTEVRWPQVKGCLPIVSFRPQIGSMYTVELHHDDSECYLSVKQTTNGISSHPKVVGRVYRTPFLRSQGFCQALTDEQSTALQQQ